MLLQGALWGQGKTAASPGFATSTSYNNELKQRPQDIEKAKALLAEAENRLPATLQPVTIPGVLPGVIVDVPTAALPGVTSQLPESSNLERQPEPAG